MVINSGPSSLEKSLSPRVFLKVVAKLITQKTSSHWQLVAQ